MARDAQLVEYDDGLMAFVVSGRRDPTEQRHDLRKLRDSRGDTREIVRRIVDDHGEDQFVENDRHDFESHDDRPIRSRPSTPPSPPRPRSPAQIALMETSVHVAALVRSVVGCRRVVSRMPCRREVGF
jgi:hypothetical protein